MPTQQPSCQSFLNDRNFLSLLEFSIEKNSRAEAFCTRETLDYLHGWDIFTRKILLRYVKGSLCVRAYGINASASYLRNGPNPLERIHNTNSSSIRFQLIRQNDIPRGRQGKHTKFVEQLLRRLGDLEPGTALKVALASLPATKANIRSALNRATHKRGIRVATSSDSRHLYVWTVTGQS